MLITFLGITIHLLRFTVARMSLIDYYPQPPPTNETWSLRSDFTSVYRLPHTCNFPLEVLFVQDATRSFEDDIKQLIATEIPKITSYLQLAHPRTTFGLLSFKDKPSTPHGDDVDYCFQLDSTLNRDPKKLMRALKALHVGGGGDHAESQFHALVAAAKVAEWDENPLATRLIVLATDSEPHFAYDLENANGLTPYDHTSEMEDACRRRYYPDVVDVVEALESLHSYVAFLIFDEDGDGFHPRADWRWFNSRIGQPIEFFQSLRSDSSDYWEKLRRVVFSIEQKECWYNN